MKQLTFQEKIDLLRVIRTKNIGPISFFHLLDTYKNINKVISMLETKINVMSKEEAMIEFNKIENFGAKLVAFCEPEYPVLLRKLRDAPPVITVKGDISLLKKNIFSIAGSRSCSMHAQALTKKIATELSDKHYVIAAGLARGIDSVAHAYSLNKGTIAILPNGIDQIYPSENEELYSQISKKGLLISETPFGSRPSSHLFLSRNRIIAGISSGVLIAEAGLKSGSLTTAQYALEYGREVFAIPGCPLDPRSRGTNNLIKHGANLVENTEDILNCLYHNRIQESVFEYNFNDDEPIALEKTTSIEKHKIDLLNLVGFFPVSIEFLSNKLDLSISLIRSLLVELEIEGKITHTLGNKVIASVQNQ
ncbi:MAG: DNA-protecting protein DprA [Alphaproteobacteria bacterium]|nr:MAG: DNA-protecting protein DprA [Alphaproteobacteria bacterium]